MNEQLLLDWETFCKDGRDFPDHYFDSLFLDPPSKSQLRRVFSAFSRCDDLVKLISPVYWPSQSLLDFPADTIEKKVLQGLKRDMHERSRLLRKYGYAELAAQLETCKYEYTEKCEEILRTARQSHIHGEIIQRVGNIVVRRVLPNDRRVKELFSILYFIGNSPELRWYLLSPLYEDSGFTFSGYWQSAAFGGIYAITKDCVLASSNYYDMLNA